MRTRIARLLGVVLMVTACNGGGDATTSTSSPSTIPPVTSTTEAVTATTGATIRSIAATTTTSRPLGVIVQAGEVVGPERFSFDIGDQVSIWVLSDTDDEVHVHGYDVYFEAQAGVPVEIALTADVPGPSPTSGSAPCAPNTPCFSLWLR